MGKISKVLGGGNAIVAGSTGASFYAGKSVGSSKVPVQSDLNELKNKVSDLFKIGPKPNQSDETESKLISDITKARRCSNYMWPGLVVGDTNSRSSTSITGGCLHIDLKYSQERSILAHIEMTLSDGNHGIIFGGQISPARSHKNHVEFLWWRMNVDKEKDSKWKIGSGAVIQYNVLFGHNIDHDAKKQQGEYFGVYSTISFDYDFFRESKDTVVDLFRVCSRTGSSTKTSNIHKSCDFSKDSPDMWVHKTKTYKWDLLAPSTKGPDYHVPEVLPIKFNNRLDVNGLIWGTPYWNAVERKSTEQASPTHNPWKFSYYMKDGKWEMCIDDNDEVNCKNQSSEKMWGHWWKEEGVKKASKVVRKINQQKVDLSILKEF